MKSLTLKQLEADKEKLTTMIKQTQIQLYRLDGALGYVQDNIKAIKGEEKNDRN